MELKNRTYYYQNAKELKDILMDIDLSLNASENYQNFLPEPVMEKFNDVFIKY